MSCRICKRRHATVLHSAEKSEVLADDKMKEKTDQTTSLRTTTCKPQGGTKSCSKVLLVDATFPGASSKRLRCYAIVDEQSSASFVDPKVLSYFNLSFPTKDYKIKTLSGLVNSISGMEVTGVRLTGVDQEKSFNLGTILTNTFIPDSLDEVATPEYVQQHRHIRHLANKFPQLDEEAEVLFLIGRDCESLMQTRCYGNKAPYAHRTPLGWALVGSVNNCASLNDPQMKVLKVAFPCTSEHLDVLPSFSAQENSSLKRDIFAEFKDDELLDLSKDDTTFMQKVSSTIRVNHDGNISMPLPFKSSEVCLPDNRIPVLKRTQNTLSRLKSDPDKLAQCVTSMGKNLREHHVAEVPEDELKGTPGKIWHLPVFPVTHPKKGKVRLVWDSAASYGGVSLNKELLSGPDINTQLFTVLTRFRKHDIAFTADVEAMFYAFHLEAEDRDFTRFFWWKDNDPSKEIVTYRANRHIFGNTSSPSLANIGLRFAVLNSKHTTEDAQSFVFKNFYMDDGCGSASSPEQAIKVLKDTVASLQNFNIRLHKIASNSPTVIEAFPDSEIADGASRDFNHSENFRTLGVEWNSKTDRFAVRTNVPTKPFTKRGVLATINSIFDPLGFASPIVLSGRLLQRKLVPPNTGDEELIKLDWDDPLPDRYLPLWNELVDSFKENDGILEIPRCYHLKDFNVSNSTLHVFSDASIQGTGYVAYLRSVSTDGRVHVAFVAANSHLPPRKTLSIPRLELCAAMDASLAAHKLCESLEIEHESVSLYSDSQVVLGYLTNRTKKFSRYVTRRVNITLSSFPDSQWRYVSSEENPGDLASRPQTFQSLNNSMWFKGPSFLWEPDVSERNIPVTEDLPEMLDTETVHKISQCTHHETFLDSAFKNCGSWKKLVKVMVFVLQFVRNLKNKILHHEDSRRDSCNLVSNSEAKTTIYACVQRQHFPECFDRSSKVPNDINQLAPFLDNHDLIRVGGRLQRSMYPEEIKHPILLPGKHRVSELLVTHYHEETNHQGRLITTGKIREEGIYILHGTTVIKRVIFQCSICRRLRGKPLEQQMAELPSVRIEETAPFTYVGLDVFGPFYVSEGVSTRRTKSERKMWAIVFICLTCKAIHLEPLWHMDTSSFKHALRRFLCTRGNCVKMYSDRGTNFIGAYNQDASAVDLEEVRTSIGSTCEWIFNPPKSSHFGGIWERSIRSIRKILDASLLLLGKRLPSREELHTFLCEAAFTVNNTPMYEVSVDPNDELPISPAQLLTSKGTPNPPSLDSFSEEDINAYGRRRWRRVQALSADFWNRWRSNHLQELQKRHKWHKVRPNLSEGDVVLLKSKEVRRNLWPLAMVTSVKVSEDGLVRSATLRLPSDSSKRAIILDRPIKDIVPIVRKSEATGSE